MARDQMSRIEELLMRAAWLVLKAEMDAGRVSEKDFADWCRDYYNAGGGTITPRLDR
jgi:hypothetical protein